MKINPVCAHELSPVVIGMTYEKKLFSNHSVAVCSLVVRIDFVCKMKFKNVSNCPYKRFDILRPFGRAHIKHSPFPKTWKGYLG